MSYFEWRFPYRYISRMASQNGDDATYNANGNYASTAAYWEIRPTTSEFLMIARMMVYVEDFGAFGADDYGNGISLSNGVQVSKVRGTGATATELDNYTPIAITSNTLWGAYTYDTSLNAFGAGNDAFHVRWTFARGFEYEDSSGDGGIMLDGRKDEAIRITLNDDFSGLVAHYFVFQGRDRRARQGGTY